MDVFGAALEARAFLCDAALAAGHKLGVFEALVRMGLVSLDRLAAEVGVVSGLHRLRALLDVLAALDAITCERWLRCCAACESLAPAFTSDVRPAVRRGRARGRPRASPAAWSLIKDLRVDDDRAGSIAGLLFALNMAIYTEAGDVYSISQLRA